MIRLENIETRRGHSHILHGVNLEIPDGQVACLIGRNGVGKTTTLRSVVGLSPAFRGRIMLDNTDIVHWPTYRIARAGIAYVPEGHQVFPELTVMENIQIALVKGDTDWPLHRILTLFPALEPRGENLAQSLSGGEQQMLCIARALASNPRLIVLDEPSQGLAPKMLEEVARTIEILRDADVGVFLVEQNLALAEAVADVIHVMVKGKIVESLSKAEFQVHRKDIIHQYLVV